MHTALCVCVCVCVHLGWVKFRAQIPSMGHHTWPCHVAFTFSILLIGTAARDSDYSCVHVFIPPMNSAADFTNFNSLRTWDLTRDLLVS